MAPQTTLATKAQLAEAVAVTEATLTDEIAARIAADSTEQTARIAGDVATLTAAHTYTDTAIAALPTSDGGTVSAPLLEWAMSGTYEQLVTRYDDPQHPDLPTTATVLWPNGNTGMFTTTAFNEIVDAIDAYQITYEREDGPTILVEQPRVTRTGFGQVAHKPPLQLRGAEIRLAELDPDKPFSEYGEISMHDLTIPLLVEA